MVDRHFTAVGDIENSREIMFRHECVGGGNVFYEDKVAGLLPVTENGDVFIGKRFRDEDRNRGGVCAFRILARAEHIEITDGRRSEGALSW